MWTLLEIAAAGSGLIAALIIVAAVATGRRRRRDAHLSLGSVEANQLARRDDGRIHYD